jgi:hypothetical protein
LKLKKSLKIPKVQSEPETTFIWLKKKQKQALF